MQHCRDAGALDEALVEAFTDVLVEYGASLDDRDAVPKEQLTLSCKS